MLSYREAEGGRDVFTEIGEDLNISRHEAKKLVFFVAYGADLKQLMKEFGVDELEASLLRRKVLRIA